MITELLDCFDKVDTLVHVDNLLRYELKFTAKPKIEKIRKLNSDLYDAFSNLIKSYGYDWSLDIEEIDYSIRQSSFIEPDEDDFDDDEVITVSLNLYKKGKTVLIVDEDIFFNTLYNMGIENVLKVFNDNYKDGILFVNNSPVQISLFYIGYNETLSSVNQTLPQISNQCQFKNASEIAFAPEHFNLHNIISTDRLLEFLNKIYLSYLLIFISDKSEFKKNNLYLKLSGLKTQEFNINIETMSIKDIRIYEKIYNWIYGEKSKVEDKIGIARNIISIYLNVGSIEISEDVFNSILSANNTYIKNNVSKYIEARGKIHEQVEQISNKVNSSLESFYNNFQKTVFVFISFYLTVFILKFYTKTDIGNAISKEATLMGIGLLSLSAVFLIFSNWILNLEKKRIRDRYQSIKERALDLLVEEDVNLLLKNDAEFNKENIFLERRRCIYIILWLLTLLIFTFILFQTSNYI